MSGHKFKNEGGVRFCEYCGEYLDELKNLRVQVDGQPGPLPRCLDAPNDGPQGQQKTDLQTQTCQEKIIFKEDGKFLNLTGVPDSLKLRSGLQDFLYLRDCYADLIEDIMKTLSSSPTRRKTVAILGTAGIGKSSMFLVLLKMLLDNPGPFGLMTRSFYYQTRRDTTYLYRHEEMDTFSCHKHDGRLDTSIILFADMDSENESPTEHAGISFIFTSFRPSRYRELTKNGWRKIMPTWSADEQAELFNSTQFRSQYGDERALRAYGNIQYFGGSVRNNIEFSTPLINPIDNLDVAMRTKGDLVCEKFFKSGFGGTEEVISDVLVHRNPRKENDVFNFNADLCTFFFASPYVLRCLIERKNHIFAAGAREKFNRGFFGGGDDGIMFELLCLCGFKISGVGFLAQPLTDGAFATTVVFPPKEVLVINWRERENYLQADVLYIPSTSNLESGDAFCLINIKERWTLVILQCTIAETHPVKQNGVKIIYDSYTKKSSLAVDETVIMFMIPKNGKLRTEQSLVTQVLTEVKQANVKVAAQYKIENELATMDELSVFFT